MSTDLHGISGIVRPVATGAIVIWGARQASHLQTNMNWYIVNTPSVRHMF